MKGLSKILKEAQATETNSWKTFDLAYGHLQRVRQLIQQTVILGKQETNRQVAKLNQEIKDRKKGPDGKLTNALQVWEYQQSRYRWNARLVRFLRDAQRMESDLLDILSARGMGGVVSEDDLERLDFYKPREPEEEEEDR